MKLGNIKVTKGYKILFSFSLSYMGYETLILFTLRPPYILSCTLTLWLGELDKKQLCQSVLGLTGDQASPWN